MVGTQSWTPHWWCLCFLPQLNCEGILRALHTSGCQIFPSCYDLCVQWDREHVGVTPRAVTPQEQRKLRPVSSHLSLLPFDLPSGYIFSCLLPSCIILSLLPCLRSPSSPSQDPSLVRGIGPSSHCPSKQTCLRPPCKPLVESRGCFQGTMQSSGGGEGSHFQVGGGSFAHSCRGLALCCLSSPSGEKERRSGELDCRGK